MALSSLRRASGGLRQLSSSSVSCLSWGLSGLANVHHLLLGYISLCWLFWGHLECSVGYGFIKSWDLGPRPGCGPATVTSPVHGDLPVALRRQGHPVQVSSVVGGIDATKHHHTATLVIAMESWRGNRNSFVYSFLPSFTRATDHKARAFSELPFALCLRRNWGPCFT